MPRRWADNKRRSSGRSRIEKLPSKETLAEILRICSSKTRAAVLLLASSGMRVGELVRVRVSDLDLSQHPPVVRVRDALNPRKWRVSFITVEAKGAVEHYLVERKNRGERIEENTPLFAYESGSSMTPQAMVSMIRRAFEAAGFRGHKMKLESQILRRWFKRQLIGAGTPRKVVEFLCGQVRRHGPSEDEVRRWYTRAVPHLTISRSGTS